MDIQYLCIASLLIVLALSMVVRASHLEYNFPVQKVALARETGNQPFKSMEKKRTKVKLSRVERAEKNLKKAKANLRLARLIEKAINEAKNSQG